MFPTGSTRSRFDPAANDSSEFLEHRGHAEYSGRARVVKAYDDGDGPPIVVLATSGFRFYSCLRKRVSIPRVGSAVDFDGTLLLDHYIWVEFLEDYPDPRDLFYTLRVARILNVVDFDDHGTAGAAVSRTFA